MPLFLMGVSVFLYFRTYSPQWFTEDTSQWYLLNPNIGNIFLFVIFSLAYGMLETHMLRTQLEQTVRENGLVDRKSISDLYGKSPFPETNTQSFLTRKFLKLQNENSVLAFEKVAFFIPLVIYYSGLGKYIFNLIQYKDIGDMLTFFIFILHFGVSVRYVVCWHLRVIIRIEMQRG
ncbi:MAG: hypothetical protein PHV17_08315 [Candidatus Omnitrophica bacterium]|nr:hypothetical protein [Candidatus Omnitrophota bacterium]